jgi:hypothetical protein
MGYVRDGELEAEEVRAGCTAFVAFFVFFRNSHLHSENRDLSLRCQQGISLLTEIEDAVKRILDKGKPIVRWGRKAMGS